MNFHSFRNHVYSRHSKDDQPMQDPEGQSLVDDISPPSPDPTPPAPLAPSNLSPLGQVDDTDDGIQDPLSSESHFSTIQKAAALWILKIRETHRIPQSVMESIIKDIESLYQVQCISI